MQHQLLETAWERYRSNLLRHLAAISVYTERNTMARLTARDYPRLAMNYGPPLTLLAQRPQRLTDLAAALGVSKQLCLQSLKPIEAAGYIRRRDDPSDRRAKLVGLTDLGLSMVGDALRELQAINREFEQLLGRDTLQAMTQQALTLNRQLHTPGTGALNELLPTDPMLPALIGALTRQLHKQLMQATIARGHRGLQMSFGQVLSCIDLEGTAIGTIAAQNGVSSPAISRIARELETLDYILRQQDPQDRRTVKLYFTQRGLQLISDSVATMAEIEDAMRQMIGDRSFKKFCAAAEMLYRRLNLEHNLVKDFRPELVDALLNTGSQITDAVLSKGDILTYLESVLARDKRPPAVLEKRLLERLTAAELAELKALLGKLRT